MGRALLLNRLRRAAERVTAGDGQRALVSDGVGTLQNNPKTTRGVYRMMKKGAQREARRTRHG